MTGLGYNDRNTSVLFSFTKEFLTGCVGALIKSFLSYLSTFHTYRNAISGSELYHSCGVTDRDHLRFIKIAAFSIRFFLALPMEEKKLLGPIPSILSGYLNAEDFSQYVFKRVLSYANEKQFVLLHSSIDCLSSLLFLIDFALSKERWPRESNKDTEEMPMHLIASSADVILSNFFYDIERINSIVLLSKSMTYIRSRGLLLLAYN